MVLGDKLTPSRVVEMAIHGHNLPYEFAAEVLAEAAAVPLDVEAGMIAHRVDLRALPLVTIDGEDAKDFDDAVYCEPDAKGFRLIVAIADVSHYVHPGTALDDEAVLRSTSVYFPGFVVPMLPETLSNGICSLKPKVDRLCFVCDMHVDFEGKVSHSKFYEAVMNSKARLTYTQVWNAVGEDDAEARDYIGSLMPQIERLHQLYRILAKARAQRGAIEFESSEVRFTLDTQGEWGFQVFHGITPETQTSSHQFWALAHELRAVPSSGRDEFYRQAHQVVLEDLAVYEGQQRSLDTDPRGASAEDVGSTVAIEADRGLLHARQIIRELLRSEAEPRTSQQAPHFA